MRHLICTGAFVSLSFGCASAQELWRGAEVGDTLLVLKEKFPGAVPTEKPYNYDEGKTAPLILDQEEIGGEVFDVHFIMDGSGLTTVRMTQSVEATGQPTYAPTFHKLETALSRRYGAPIFEMPAKMSDPGFLRMLENQYREGPLTVSLACMFCSTERSILSIVYDLDSAEIANEF